MKLEKLSEKEIEKILSTPKYKEICREYHENELKEIYENAYKPLIKEYSSLKQKIENEIACLINKNPIDAINEIEYLVQETIRAMHLNKILKKEKAVLSNQFYDANKPDALDKLNKGEIEYLLFRKSYWANLAKIVEGFALEKDISTKEVCENQEYRYEVKKIIFETKKEADASLMAQMLLEKQTKELGQESLLRTFLSMLPKEKIKKIYETRIFTIEETDIKNKAKFDYFSKIFDKIYSA